MTSIGAKWGYATVKSAIRVFGIRAPACECLRKDRDKKVYGKNALHLFNISIQNLS